MQATLAATTLRRPSPTSIAESIALKLLLIAFKNVEMVLGSVESGVEDLMDDLAEQICDLMMEYEKGLRDDFVDFNFWSEIHERWMTNKRGERKVKRERVTYF